MKSLDTTLKFGEVDVQVMKMTDLQQNLAVNKV